MEGQQTGHFESSGEPNRCCSVAGHQGYPKVRSVIMATTNTSEDTLHTSSFFSAQQEDTDEFFDSIQYQANMSKRRLRYSGLQQENDGSSRVNKIRNIFEEAVSDPVSLSAPVRRIPQQAASLGCPIPSSPNKAVRLSIHKTVSDYLPSSPEPSFKAVLPCPQSLDSLSANRLPRSINSSPLRPARKPLSSGHNTPSRIPRPVRDLNTVKLTAGFTYGDDSDDEDIHSTHGVPLIMPIRSKESDDQQKTSTVSQWLQMVELPDIDENCGRSGRSIKEKAKAPQGKVNNKENSRPQGGATYNHMLKDLLNVGSSKAASVITALPKPIRGHIPNKPVERFSQYTRANDNVVKRNTPPTGLLLLPPRRIGQTPNTSMPLRDMDLSRPINSLCQKPKVQQIEDARCHSVPPNQTSQDEDLIELSPSVNRNRRRHGIIKKGSPNVNEANKDSSTNIELADFILALEAHDREEEVQRGRSKYRL